MIYDNTGLDLALWIPIGITLCFLIPFLFLIIKRLIFSVFHWE